MIHYLFIGTVLGLSAGLAPGPLLALVISETVVHDIRAGIRVCMAPLITDPPIIALTIFILSRLSAFHTILGMISMVGGIVVFIMGIQNIRVKGMEVNIEKARPKSLIKGIVVNLLSPHPYLFWLSVGAPIMTRAMDINVFASAAFVICFYLLLVGSKIVLAVLVGKSKTFLQGRVYIYTMKFLGVALCSLALFLFKDGFRLLGIL